MSSGESGVLRGGGSHVAICHIPVAACQSVVCSTHLNVGVPGSVELGRNTGPLSKPYLFLLVHAVSQACAGVGV